MIKIQCDACPEDSINLTPEQIEEVLTFDGQEKEFTWGEAYPEHGYHVGVWSEADADSAWLTRESFEALRQHVTEIVEVPRSEVQPGEMFDHTPDGPFNLQALDSDSLYLDLPRDGLPCVMNNQISWSYPGNICYVRRPKAVKPDRLAGLRKVFPDGEYEESTGLVKCSTPGWNTVTLENLIRLQEEYPKGKISVLANGPDHVCVWVDGV